MAINVLQVAGATNGTPGASATTAGLTTTAGSTCLVIGGVYNTSGSSAGTDFTDSKGNTYTLIGGLLGGASAVGIAAAYNTGGTRGTSHTFSYNGPGAGESNNVAVIEISAGAALTLVAGSLATGADGVSPFDLAMGAALSGTCIAIGGCIVDTGGSNAWTPPSGYTNIYELANGSQDLVWNTCYKNGETGTPTLSWSNADTVGGGGCRQLVFAFQEGAGSQSLTVPTGLVLAVGVAPTVARVPDAPTGLTTTPGDSQMGLTWTAPFDGGSPITDYRVIYRRTP